MVRQSKNKEAQLFYSDPDYIAQGILSSDFVFDPGGKSLKGGAYTLRSWRDDFYVWKDGCYTRMSDAEMKRIIARHIQELNDSIQDDEQRISVTSQRVNNILLCLKGRIGISESRELSSWDDGREKLFQALSFKNGLLQFGWKDEKPALIEHTPRYFTLTQLPYEYDPDAKCDNWLMFLDDIMQSNKEYILLLQQWTGYLFRPDLQEQKFLLCCGEGANGKGVFFEVIQSLVGKDNCSQVNLARFNSPFALYGTLGKVVNATNESSHIITDEAEMILKSFVVGDRFTFERKFKEPVYTYPTAKIMIATNALPRFNDKTQGIWRRILLVRFDKVIKDKAQIKDLAETLKKELPGILNWALEGLEKLNKNGGFNIPEVSKKLLEDYRKDADPARAFLLENYAPSLNGDGIPCSELYEQYKQYCDQNGCRRMNSRTFGQHVRRIFPNVERIRSGSRDNREWLYQGLVSYAGSEPIEGKIDNIPF